MHKKIVSVLLSVALIMVMVSIAAVSVAAVDTKTYYFLMPDEWYSNDQITGAGIYWWEGTGGADMKWPGVKADPVEGYSNVFKYDVPADVPVIIWNNNFDGGPDETDPKYVQAYQIKDFPSESYWEGDSDLYPGGIGNFDGMIAVVDPEKTDVNYQGKKTYVAEWYYPYGDLNCSGALDDDEYGTDKTKLEKPLVPHISEKIVETCVINKVYEARVGDIVTYVYEIKADEKIQGVEAVLNYDPAYVELQNLDELNSEKGFENLAKYYPVLKEDVISNTEIDGEINFNVSKPAGFDFREGGVLITAQFKVLQEGETEIKLNISQLYSDKEYINDGVVSAEGLEILQEDVIIVPEPETTVPPTTVATTPVADTTAAPATTTSAVTTTASVQSTTTVSSKDQATTSPNAKSSTSGGTNTVKTGSEQIAITLLLILLAATVVMGAVRKKMEG